MTVSSASWKKADSSIKSTNNREASDDRRRGFVGW
jgi:hypothetical protein